jgi:hypothetical protein
MRLPPTSFYPEIIADTILEPGNSVIREVETQVRQGSSLRIRENWNMHEKID